MSQDQPKCVPMIPGSTYTDPVRYVTEDQFKPLLHETRKHGASDIFLQSGSPVIIQVNGQMFAVNTRELDPTELDTFLNYAAGRPNAANDLASGKPVNASLSLNDPELFDEDGFKIQYGYRVNASPVQVKGTSSLQIVLRPIPSDPPSYDQIGLDQDLVDYAACDNGIVYVCGSTGSGKTTTFASIIRYIMEHDTPIRGNIITHEEPIEFTYSGIRSRHSIIVQSEIGRHFKTFHSANREAMRRKPALLLVGEMRDEESITAGIELALTGHPVFATVHAINVAAVMRRLISRFPESSRSTAIYDLVETARLIIAQRLVKGVDGGLVAVREYLKFTPEIRDTLIGLTDMGMVTHEIEKIMQSEKGHSFADDAKRLLGLGLIDERTASRLVNIK